MDAPNRATLPSVEVRHLASLIAIAEHGTFSAAARAIGTVQSNVSAHISRLEKELGVQLVDRASGRLTEDGQVVVERGRRIINELEDIEADINSTAVIEGDTRLGVLGTTGRWLLPSFLTALRTAHPRVRATVFEGSTSTLIPPLVTGDLDAALVNFPVDEPGLDVEPLFAEELLLICTADHPWASLESITMQQLAEHPLLLPPRNAQLRRIIDRAAGSQRVSLQPQVEIDGVRLITSLALDGFGPAIVPATALPKHFAGDIRRIAIPQLPRRMVGWASRRRPLPNKATRAALEVAREAVRTAGHDQPGVSADPRSMHPVRAGGAPSVRP
jgi:molybdate transport repressor ModE-like protein